MEVSKDTGEDLEKNPVVQKEVSQDTGNHLEKKAEGQKIEKVKGSKVVKYAKATRSRKSKKDTLSKARVRRNKPRSCRK